MFQSPEELKPNNPQTLTSHCKLTITRKPPAKKIPSAMSSQFM